jgi:hypothetical protein
MEVDHKPRSANPGLGLWRLLTTLDSLMYSNHRSGIVTLSNPITEDLELEHMLDNTRDESQQPLIVDGNDDDATILPEITKREANRLIWLLTLTAGLSGLLFGYE